jgi:hypothetical protein
MIDAIYSQSQYLASLINGIRKTDGIITYVYINKNVCLFVPYTLPYNFTYFEQI